MTKLEARHLFLILSAGLFSACGEQATSIFGDCEIIDRDTDMVVDSREQVTERVCRNLALENEGDVYYEWERDESSATL